MVNGFPLLHHLITSYAFTFLDNSARQIAESKKSANQQNQSGGSFKITSLATRPSKSVMCPAVPTKVPNNPAVTFRRNASMLMMCPHLVVKIWFMISANPEGIKYKPISAALAAMRHLTQAEIVCESSASISIHVTLARKIALAIQRLSANQLKPSRYA